MLYIEFAPNLRQVYIILNLRLDATQLKVASSNQSVIQVLWWTDVPLLHREVGFCAVIKHKTKKIALVWKLTLYQAGFYEILKGRGSFLEYIRKTDRKTVYYT